MHHLIVPMDEDHRRAVGGLATGVARALGQPAVRPPACPHVTVVAFTGLDRAAARAVVAEALAGLTGFTVRAHGYGVFARSGHSGPSLNVPVVRSAPLDALHRRAHDALVAAGAEVAGWTTPDCWSPHITLVQDALAPAELGRAVGALADGHHPSWHVPVRELLVVRGGDDPIDRAHAVPLAPAP